MSDIASIIPQTGRQAVEYPSSDGRPVAETDLHYDRLTDVVAMLKYRYGCRSDVYVGANMLVYDEPGNVHRHLSPDAFVAFGVPNRRRDVFKLWEERAPSFVLEVTSRSTRGEDAVTKRRRYGEWGVAEYFQYDPRGEYLFPPLQGLRLVGAGYRDMAERVLPNGARGFHSETLGLHLWLRNGELRMYDPEAGGELLTPAEERRGRIAAEARVRELEARLRTSDES